MAKCLDKAPTATEIEVDSNCRKITDLFWGQERMYPCTERTDKNYLRTLKVFLTG
jgi:hypothetical protein